MLSITREKARIFRVTHIENIGWAASHGLHCMNSPIQDPAFREIGNPDIIGKRGSRIVPIQPGGTLNDYIPFYFTPFSPMLLNIKTGFNGIRRVPMDDIVILVGNLPHLSAGGHGWVFTDRHSLLSYANFFNDLEGLAHLDWEGLQARDFRRDPENPEKMERYQAEALIHRQMPLTGLAGIVCHGPKQEEKLKLIMKSSGIDLKVAIRPDWYF